MEKDDRMHVDEIMEILLKENKPFLKNNLLFSFDPSQNDGEMHLIEFNTGHLVNTKLSENITKKDIENFLFLTNNKVIITDKERKCALVDLEKKEVIKEFEASEIKVSKKYGFFIYGTYELGILNFNGDEILPNAYKDIYIDEERGRLVVTNEYEQVTVMDIQGNVVSYDGLQVIKEQEGLKVLNSKGEIIIGEKSGYDNVLVNDISKIIIALKENKNDTITEVKITDFNGNTIFNKTFNFCMVEILKEFEVRNNVLKFFSKKPELLRSSDPIKEIPYDLYLNVSNIGASKDAFFEANKIPEQIFVRTSTGKIVEARILGIYYIQSQNKVLITAKENNGSNNDEVMIDENDKIIFGPVRDISLVDDNKFSFTNIKKNSDSYISGYIDDNGKILYQSLKKSFVAKSEHENDCYVATKNIVTISVDNPKDKERKLYGFMDYNGNIIIPPEYDKIRSIEGTESIILDKYAHGKDILIDKEGKIKFTADQIICIGDKLIEVEDQGKGGIMDGSTGEWIVPLIEGFDKYISTTYILGDLIQTRYAYPLEENNYISFTIDARSKEIVGTYCHMDNFNPFAYMVFKTDVEKTNETNMNKVKSKVRAEDGER